MNHHAIMKALLARCVEQGLFVAGAPVDPHSDLVDAGQVDSMGLVQLQAVIEETFGLLIPVEIFVAELRSVSRIALYLESEIRAGRAHPCASPAAE